MRNLNSTCDPHNIPNGSTDAIEAYVGAVLSKLIVSALSTTRWNLYSGQSISNSVLLIN